MLTDNLIIVIAIMGFVAILALILMIVAARHDHEIAAAPRYRTLDVLDEEIELKTNIKGDLEAELEKRREAIGLISDKRQEVDLLQKKLDDLEVEWGQSEARRNEVFEVRKMMEDALNEKLNAESDLAQIRNEYEEKQERIIKAERLFAELADKTKLKEELEKNINELKSEEKELLQAKEIVENLEIKAKELENNIINFEARSEEAKARSKVLEDREDIERKKLIETEVEIADLSATLASSRDKVTDLDHKRASLEARNAKLQNDINETSGVTTLGDDDAVEERLKELKVLPPVLNDMKNWKSGNPDDENDALKGVFDRLKKFGLEYHPRVVNAFHTSMKVNETSQMAVLAGISGTGKSQLPRQYALGMGIGFLQVPVQPRWDSPQDLMGFYNYIEKRFRPTDMAKALYQLDILNNPKTEFNDHMMMILLDEMNLAKVEYYFSDFLSRLESRPSPTRVDDLNLRKDAEIELEIPMPKGLDAKRIFPGFNLLFAGTMNEDESTQALSDKVVDRANVLRFAAPKKLYNSSEQLDVDDPKFLNRARWEKWQRSTLTLESDQNLLSKLDKMRELMAEFNKPFGHRLGKAILSYVANYPEVEGQNLILTPIADQVEMRLLPKLRGVEIEKAEQSFEKLSEFVAKDLADEELSNAIKNSLEAGIQSGTGQFVWNGITRG